MPSRRKRIWNKIRPNPNSELNSAAKPSDPQRSSILPALQLDPFFDIDNAPGSSSDIERTNLQKAAEELEAVLQALSGEPSTTKFPNLESCFRQAKTSPSPLSLKDIATAAHNDQEERSQTALSRAGSFMQKLYPLSKIVLGIGGAVSLHVGHAPVQIVTNALAQVLELVMSVPKQSDQVVDGLGSIAVDDHLLAELDRLPRDALDGVIISAAIELQTTLIYFLRKSLLWLKKDFFSRFANCIIDPTRMEDARSELIKAQRKLRDAIADDSFLTSKWNEIASTEKGLLDRICPSEYHNAQLRKQTELHSTRLSDSGTWAVTDHRFLDWRNDGCRILWCPGLPGAGKTYIVSRIIDDLEHLCRHKDAGLAFVYCESNRATTQSKQAVLEALARQLIARKPGLCFSFKNELELALPTKDSRELLLKNIFRRFGRTYLILDALDEYSPEYPERLSLACLMRDIVDECKETNVRLCVTSREASGIWAELRASNIGSAQLDVCSSVRDIEALAQRSYDKAAEAIKWMKNNGELRQIFANRVVEKSDRIFKLAGLQIQAALRAPTAREMKKVLENLTTDVNEYYEESMLRIASHKDTSTTVFRLLTWLTFVRSPIYLHELKHALGLPSDGSVVDNVDDLVVDVPFFVGLSEGLVTMSGSLNIDMASTNSLQNERPESEVDAEDYLIYRPTYKSENWEAHLAKGPQVLLAHQSIREYLVTRTTPIWLHQDGNAFILDSCLSIMTSPLFLNKLCAILCQLRMREEDPACAKRKFSIKSQASSSRVVVPEFLFWALSSWGEYLPDTGPTSRIYEKVHKIHDARQVEKGSSPMTGLFEHPDQLFDRSLARSTLSNNVLFLDSNSSSGYFASPLHWCAIKGWFRGCKILLPLEEDPNVLWTGSRLDGRSGLFGAICSGSLDTLKVFLDDPRVDPNMGMFQLTRVSAIPPIPASQRGRQSVAEMLNTREDVNINAYSRWYGDVSFLKFLRAMPALPGTIPPLMQHANLGLDISIFGMRPIHHLSGTAGSVAGLETLLNHPRINVNARTDWNFIPCTMEVEFSNPIAFRDSRTALMIAAFLGFTGKVSLLLGHPDVKPQLRDDEGMTALMLASVGYVKTELNSPLRSYAQTVRILVKAPGTLADAQDNRGRTSLAFAAMCGLDPRSRDGIQDSDDIMYKRWHQAITMEPRDGKGNHIAIVKALLEAKDLDVNLSDDFGHSPLDYAIWA
ncbi:MAG: hypothetical protein M1822_007959 [Bathelium mastoideum]|nr:MAG: hypothetical protein M1822_007959 [Bathelium mastoideum]